MVITYLRVLSPTNRFWYERLSQIAREMGAEIRYARQGGDDTAAVMTSWKLLRTWLEEGDAFFLEDDTILHVEEYANRLRERVEGGARLLVRLDENSLDRQNAFLAKKLSKNEFQVLRKLTSVNRVAFTE
jgi:hypothetical protein